MKQSVKFLKFENSIQYSDEIYRVCLPCKISHKKLKSNFGLANARLKSTMSRLRKYPNHLILYNKILEDYLRRGFIKKIYSESPEMQNLHYIPDQGVMRKSATTPIRIVFDCSVGSPSLNDCLYTGLSLTKNVFKVISRFRLGKFTFISDITKRFLMINLNQENRNSTFLCGLVILLMLSLI